MPILQDFRFVLDDFVDRLRAALPALVAPNAPATPIAPPTIEEQHRVLAEMTGYLNNFDPAAADCLEANRRVFLALLGEVSLTAFERDIGEFALAEAMARLREATPPRKGGMPS